MLVSGIDVLVVIQKQAANCITLGEQWSRFTPPPNSVCTILNTNMVMMCMQNGNAISAVSCNRIQNLNDNTTPCSFLTIWIPMCIVSAGAEQSHLRFHIDANWMMRKYSFWTLYVHLFEIYVCFLL